jgi:hypothetical protein
MFQKRFHLPYTFIINHMPSIPYPLPSVFNTIVSDSDTAAPASAAA